MKICTFLRNYPEMKTLISAILLLWAMENAWAQDCLVSSYFKKNSKLEFRTTDEGGKLQTRVEYEVIETKSTGNHVEAVVKSTVFDKKEKQLSTADVVYQCTGSEFRMNMRSYVPAQQTQGMKDMQVKADDSYLIFPRNMTTGSRLPDGNFHLETSMNGMKIMSLNLSVTDRQVVGKESVTTPAGTYDCLKITTRQQMKSVMSFDYETTEWYAPSNGIVVKTELYRKGKLQSISQLTELIN